MLRSANKINSYHLLDSDKHKTIFLYLKSSKHNTQLYPINRGQFPPHHTKTTLLIANNTIHYQMAMSKQTFFITPYQIINTHKKQEPQNNSAQQNSSKRKKIQTSQRKKEQRIQGTGAERGIFCSSGTPRRPDWAAAAHYPSNFHTPHRRRRLGSPPSRYIHAPTSKPKP